MRGEVDVGGVGERADDEHALAFSDPRPGRRLHRAAVAAGQRARPVVGRVAAGLVGDELARPRVDEGRYRRLVVIAGIVVAVIVVAAILATVVVAVHIVVVAVVLIVIVLIVVVVVVAVIIIELGFVAVQGRAVEVAVGSRVTCTDQ